MDCSLDAYPGTPSLTVCKRVGSNLPRAYDQHVHDVLEVRWQME